MCGRARCTLGRNAVTKYADVDQKEWRHQDQYTPKENAHPGQCLPVLHMEDGQRRVTTMRWGLIPSFVKPGESHDFFRMFNARSETIVHRPAFKRLVPDRRCVVILDGFYEWKDDGSPVKQPYYLRSRAGGGEPLLLAGLYDVWRPEAGAEPLWSFTICTAEAGKGIEWLHDRMPCLLTPEQAERWICPDTPLEELLRVLRARDASLLHYHKVTKRVNNMSYDKPDASRPLDEKKLARGKISYFFGAPQSAAGKGAQKRDRAPMPKEEGTAEGGTGEPCKEEASSVSPRRASQAGAATRNNAEADDEGEDEGGAEDGSTGPAAPGRAPAPASAARSVGKDGSPPKRRRR